MTEINRCTFTIKQIQEVFRSTPIFNSSIMDFPTDYSYHVIEGHNKFVRDTIKSEFEKIIKSVFTYPNDMPEYYAIGMALFMYRIDQEIFLLLNDWNDFNKMCKAQCCFKEVTRTKVDTDKRDHTYCLCCHYIFNIVIIRYEHTDGKSYYTMLGEDCIKKSKIVSINETYKLLTHYNCTKCGRTCRKKSIGQQLCGKCLVKKVPIEKPIEKPIIKPLVKQFVKPLVMPLVSRPIIQPVPIVTNTVYDIIWCKTSNIWVEDINCNCNIFYRQLKTKKG